MGRTLEDVIAALPAPRRRGVAARFAALTQEVESLGELRRAAGKAQAEIATALRIRQPSVSRIARQADMYLSALRSYVEAIGGELELVVRLPERAPLRLERLGDAGAKPAAGPGIKPKRRRLSPAKPARAG